MKNEIKSVIRLYCDQDFDIKYFAKDESLVDTTMDYSELLDYINGIEDKNERLQNIIKEAREYIEDRYDGEVLTHTFDKCNVGELLEILDKENK